MVIHLAQPLIGAEEREAVDRVLRSGNLAQGPEVAAFEEEFAALVDGRTCVAVNSGTSALHLGLVAAGIGPGDEVIVPSFTFAATANAVVLAGAEPVFVDIEPAAFAIAPDAVRAAIGPRTAAVVAVHLYGHPADTPALVDICRDASLLLVEDAAQAHGAAVAGRPAGALGDLAMFSFYPTKNMTTGEGGMIVTADPAVVRRAQLLRNQGMERRYENELVGFNTRMTDLGAALGRVQLRKLAGWNETRRRHAAQYDRGLVTVTPPPVADGVTHVYHQYTIRSEDRDGLHARLSVAGIGSGAYYPTPVHRLPSYDRSLDLPETERATAEVLSLPVGPHLDADDIARVIEEVGT